MLNIWLIMSGEPLEQFGERPHRVGILSKMLVKKGHSITWWTTTFDHQHKKYLYDKDTEIVNDLGVNMVFLHPKTSYTKNISLSRIKNHQEVADKFQQISRTKDKPDIILCAFPTIELSYEVVQYGRELNIPVVIDIRDLWPEIFLDVLPKVLKPIGKLFLQDYFKKTKYIFKNTYSIIGVSEKYLDYGLNYANRRKGNFDSVFPLAYNYSTLEKKDFLNFDAKFQKLGININKKLIWFVGTFGRTYDLEPAIEIAKKLNKRDDVQFIFTGNGEKAEEWKSFAKDLDNVIFTGWVNQEELMYLANIANIGLMAYKKGAPQGLPNKVFEYLASGLPILSSLSGETQKLLENYNVGYSYETSKDLLKYLNILLNNDEKYVKMSKNARMLYEERFSADKVYGDMIVYLENIAKNFKGYEK